jgi:acetoin utilization deacetylase AcuC-like enzyme
MAGEPVLLTHPSSLDHDPGPHPEDATRIIAIERELERREWLGWARRESPPVAREVLERVHPPQYIDALGALSARGGGRIDLDTAMSAGSYAAALHGAGGAVELAEQLVAGSAPTGFSVHRPPGHHAGHAQAMGFCLFNNVAVAARHAVDGLGCARVLVFDWDVHHGNGTNDIFHSSAEVLFVSIHQMPLYPGTGAARDAGSGAGEGFTVNLPVPEGSGDGEFVGLTAGVVVPLMREFAPDLVLLSAGYDAHADDPLAGCEVTDAGFAEMGCLVRDGAAAIGAPVGAVLEGGYAPAALARSVAATMAALGGAGAATGEPSRSALVDAARERLRRWWTL